MWGVQSPGIPAAMRIISVSQPFTQLLVRGVLRYVVRGWDPRYRGLVAIHASSSVPSKADEVAWLADEAIARACVAQGWSGRRDFKQLTFGGIIGSACLVAVYRGIDIRERRTPRRWWAPSMDDQITAQRYEYGRVLRKPPPPFRPWPVPDDAYAWVFGDAVEFEPITGVKGMQRLGHLRGDVVDEIAAREKAARRRLWQAAPVDAAQRNAARLTLRTRRRAGRARLVREAEESVGRRRALAALVLRPDVEDEVRLEFTRYVVENPAPAGARGEAMVNVAYLSDTLTGGRKVMPLEEVELALRRRIVRSADAYYASRLKKMRWESLVRIAERGRTVREDEAVVRAKLESALELILREEDADLDLLRHARRRPAEDVTSWPGPRWVARAAEAAAEARERYVVRRIFKFLRGGRRVWTEEDAT